MLQQCFPFLRISFTFYSFPYLHSTCYFEFSHCSCFLPFITDPFPLAAYVFTLKMSAPISLETLAPNYQHVRRDVKKATTLFWLHYTTPLWRHSPILQRLWHCHLTTTFFGKYDNVWNITSIRLRVRKAGSSCLMHVVPNTSQPLVKILQWPDTVAS
jgi:hypothetical protein